MLFILFHTMYQEANFQIECFLKKLLGTFMQKNKIEKNKTIEKTKRKKRKRFQ